MAKIYLVSSGEYSDYGINAVYSTRQLAQQFIDKFQQADQWENYEIEERELNPMLSVITKKGRVPSWVQMSKDGNTHNIQCPCSYSMYSGNNDITFTIDKEYMNLRCFAKDETHAIKIANEKRVQLIANNQWGVNP